MLLPGLNSVLKISRDINVASQWPLRYAINLLVQSVPGLRGWKTLGDQMTAMRIAATASMPVTNGSSGPSLKAEGSLNGHYIHARHSLTHQIRVAKNLGRN